MKINLFARLFRVTFFLAVLSLFSNASLAQTSAFTYQGRLTENNANASGAYQMQFALFNAATSGSQIGSTIENTAVQVNNGIFTVQLDFGGGAFTGADLFLQIWVRKNPTDAYVPLAQRQPIASTPYAVRASVAGNAEQLNGQAAANYAASSQVSALQIQVTAQQTVIDALRAQLAATTGGTQLWSKRFGGSSSDIGIGVARDLSGNIFFTGMFLSTVIDFGGGPLNNAGSYDVFIAKLTK